VDRGEGAVSAPWIVCGQGRRVLLVHRGSLWTGEEGAVSAQGVVCGQGRRVLLVHRGSPWTGEEGLLLVGAQG